MEDEEDDECIRQVVDEFGESDNTFDALADVLMYKTKYIKNRCVPERCRES